MILQKKPYRSAAKTVVADVREVSEESGIRREVDKLSFVHENFFKKTVSIVTKRLLLNFVDTTNLTIKSNSFEIQECSDGYRRDEHRSVSDVFKRSFRYFQNTGAYR